MRRRQFTLAICCFFLAGCVSASYVPGHGAQLCIGAFDMQDPRFVYKMSVWNVTLGILFAELIIPPVIVLANATFCPVRVVD